MVHYSYLNTVFPKYENSSSYNSKLFNDLNSIHEENLHVQRNQSHQSNQSHLKHKEDQYDLTEEIIDYPTKTPVQTTTLQPIIQQDIINESASNINEIINNLNKNW